ncbi:MAG: AI-2E family transporter [Clostridia bacterium]|nr:AI-2E family transporter [Clostridia bacterium]
MKLEFRQLCKIAVVIFLLYLAIHFWPALLSFAGTLLAAASPLFIGCAIAYVLNLLMNWYERHWFPVSQKKIIVKTRRGVCLTAAILSLLLIVGLVIGLILPELTDCFMLILNKLPRGIQICLDYIEQWGILPEDIIGLLESIDWQSRIGEFLKAFTNGLGGVMGTVIKTVTSVFSGIVTALLAIIFSLYLLIGKDKLQNQCSRLLHQYCKPVWCDRIRYVLHILNDCFKKYIVGQCTEAVILGLLCTVGMAIFRFPYASMIGALVAFTALIPIAGAYIGAGVGAFMILTVSPIKALFFLIFILVLQQLEGNIIYPRVVGSSIGLPGIWVLAAVTIGGGIMGIAGMLLGVPATAALYRILQEDLHHREGITEEVSNTDTPDEPAISDEPAEEMPEADAEDTEAPAGSPTAADVPAEAAEE